MVGESRNYVRAVGDGPSRMIKLPAGKGQGRPRRFRELHDAELRFFLIKRQDSGSCGP